MGQVQAERKKGIVRAASRSAFGAVCALALVLLAGIPAFADDASASRTIRVGFAQQERMLQMNDQGMCSGYVYEYLERMAQYTGWSYEFVPVEGQGLASYQTLRDLLDAGEVDLVAGLMATSENRATYALTRDSYIALETVLWASMDREDDPVDAATVERPLRVATMPSPHLDADLEKFCTSNGIPYEAVACDDIDSARDAVLQGRADAVFAVELSDTEGLRRIADTGTHYLHFAADQDDVQLVNELDAALGRVEQSDALFRTQLRSAYFSSAAVPFALDEEERAFVERADPVRVGMLKDQPPYQYEEDGELKGIAVDLLETVAEKTGLRFEYVPAGTVEELDALQASGSLDMVGGIDYDYASARERNLALTQPFVTASYVLVANEGVADGAIAGKRLALVSSSRYQGDFVGDVRSFPSIAACLRAVFNDEADYTYVDEYVMQYFLNTPEFRSVRIAPQTHEPRRVSFGIVRSDDTTVLEIIDRAVGSLTEIELQAVINDNVLRERPFDLVEFVRANPAVAIAGGTATGLIVVLFVLIILAQRSRSNAKTAVDLKKRLQLYSLCDDRFFEYDQRTKRLIISLPGEAGEGPREPLVIDSADAARYDEERRREFIDLIEADEHRVEEVLMPNAEGEEHWLRVTVEPVKDATGRIAYSVGKIEVIDEERRERDQLVARAERDGLTGLLNAETTRSRVSEQLAALGPGERGALLVIDIDRFKDVNDTFGHLVGDRVLVDVARMLHESFRSSDVVGRLGGDEFMAFLGMVNDGDAVIEKCDHLRNVVERLSFQGTDCRVTISVGVAFAGPGEAFDDLYRRADEALYLAKRDGRNRCGVAAPS